MIYSITVFSKAFTTNQVYKTRLGQHGMYMSSEGKKFKKLIETATKLQAKDFKRVPGNVLRAVYFICGPQFLNKDGSPNMRGGDADGFVKLIQDSVCSALNINDALIYECKAIKIYKEVPKIEIMLEWVPLNGYLDYFQEFRN